MKIAVISDLHIGDERFARHAQHFALFLDYLEEHHDCIVLLGDIFETAFPLWPWQTALEYRKHFRTYRNLARRFRKAPYKLLSGNHDAVALRRWGIPYRWQLAVDGLQLLFTHGHELEKQYQSAILFRLTDLYLWAAGFLRRSGFDGLYRLAYYFDHRQNVADGGLRYIKGAQELVKKHKYDCVVMGHTHQEMLVELPEGGIYINSGDCQERCVFASIDTARCYYSLQQFVEPGQVQVLTQKSM